jgi:CheY-like chemotaxis protein
VSGSGRVVLVVEDEPNLRQSMVRGLSKLAGVQVVDAGTVAAAKAALRSSPPALVVSDLDLPDGSGVEVAAELERLGQRVPLVFVSAFLGRYANRLPSRADVEVYEKPVPLERLRAVVEDKLGGGADGAELTPFGIADYVQLAGMGRRSVVLDIHSGAGRGRVVVKRGELWSAVDGLGSGLDAFRRLAFLRAAEVVCRTLDRHDADPRNLEGAAESVLLEVARQLDEAAHAGAGDRPPIGDAQVDDAWGDLFDEPSRVGPAPPTRWPTSSRIPIVGAGEAELPRRRRRTSVPPLPLPPSLPPVPPPPAGLAGPRDAPAPAGLAEPHDAPAPVKLAEPRDAPAPSTVRFEQAYDRGLEALLARDLARAYAAFVEAEEVAPGDRRVRANLARLRELGVA